MNKDELSIVTISWARTEEEEQLLRAALPVLSAQQIPVYITDGGSGDDFVTFMKGLPNFHVQTAEAKGLWHQVKQGLQAARQAPTPFILYTEPDKLAFFQTSLSSFLGATSVNEATGVVLASRSLQAMQSFPAFQQSCENTINFCCAEVTGKQLDYTYGPFVFNIKIIDELLGLPDNIDWGWRPFVFCAAHLLGYKVEAIYGDYFCPPDQRNDDSRERIYRMKQLYQNIQGVVLSTNVTTRKA